MACWDKTAVSFKRGENPVNHKRGVQIYIRKTAPHDNMNIEEWNHKKCRELWYQQGQVKVRSRKTRVLRQICVKSKKENPGTILLGFIGTQIEPTFARGWVARATRPFRISFCSYASFLAHSSIGGRMCGCSSSASISLSTMPMSR